MTYSYPMPDPAAAAAKIKAAGGPFIDPTQPTGTASTHGVNLAWAIADGKIDITPTHKPWYVTDDQIKSGLDKFFGGAA